MTIDTPKNEMPKADAQQVAGIYIEDNATLTPMTADTQNGIVTLIYLTLGDWTGMVLASPKTMARIAAKQIPVVCSYGGHKTMEYATAIVGAIVSAHHRTTTHYLPHSGDGQDWVQKRVASLFKILSDPTGFAADLVQKHTIRAPIDPNTGTGEELARFDVIKGNVADLNNKDVSNLVVKAGLYGVALVPLDKVMLDGLVKGAYRDDYTGTSVLEYLTAGNPILKLQGDAETVDMEARAASSRAALAAIRAGNKT